MLASQAVCLFPITLELLSKLMLSIQHRQVLDVLHERVIAGLFLC